MFRAAFLPILLVALTLTQPAVAQEKPQYAGPTAEGYLLPNGWTVSPAGKQVALNDLPLNIVPLADGQHVLVATSGYNPHTLALVDAKTDQIVSKVTTRNSWFGLAVSAGQDKVWWSGASDNVLLTFGLQDKKLTSLPLPGSDKKPVEAQPKGRRNNAGQQNFRSGFCLDHDTKTIYSLDINAGTIAAYNTETGEQRKTAKCGGRPYDVARGRASKVLYVSDWAGGAVLVVDPTELRTIARIPVGEHPNQIVVHPKDDRIFVACASSNCVSVIDTKRGVVTETIVTSLFPKAPEGSTPDALALAPDGKMLYVANADNNCLAVVDIAKANQSIVKGFIPTGWYPTSTAVAPDGKTLYVGVGKGNQSHANPTTPRPAGEDEPVERRNYPYIGTLMTGSLSIVPVPDDAQLAAYTAKVYRNCPYSDKLLTGTPYPEKTAIPTRVGDRSPIEHVIYIIKENRTYDQVFGDMKKGNGDPALVMFGESVTPNHHKLAEEFVLLDNLYCNGQVSRDGHPWSTMAYNTDYISRDWHLTYSSRKGVDDDDDENLAKAPSGYIWDACARNGLSYRSYGEYGHRVSEGTPTARMDSKVPGLMGHISPTYGVSFEKNHVMRDGERLAAFLKEFRQYEKDDNLPRFIVMSLGEDHTKGTTPGQNTPQACVASNDLALGQLVEAVSHSKYWPKMAIFVIEDDAQNGPDHVDCQRTVGLVISPYVKRHHLDSTQYTTVSMLRTMELILGLPPLSQYDAAARPMFGCFTDKPNLNPYGNELARIDINAVNTRNAFGAAQSAKMDFNEYDKVDDFELNEILWRSIKGKDAPLPPAVRRAIADRPIAASK